MNVHKKGNLSLETDLNLIEWIESDWNESNRMDWIEANRIESNGPNGSNLIESDRTEIKIFEHERIGNGSNLYLEGIQPMLKVFEGKLLNMKIALEFWLEIDQEVNDYFLG